MKHLSCISPWSIHIQTSFELIPLKISLDNKSKDVRDCLKTFIAIFLLLTCR